MAIMGIDVGTSGCKVCLYDHNGTLLCISARKYPEIRGNGTREINPSIVKKQILEAIDEAAVKYGKPVDAIAVTCLGESLICIDENDNILCNSMVTGDNRGQAGVDLLCSSCGADYIFNTTGLMPSQLYSLPKLIWLKENTDCLKSVKKIFFYEDYVGYLLTGERKVSFSSASRSMAFDIHHLKWDEKLLSYADLCPEIFSSPVPSGTVIGFVRPEIASLYHWGKSVPVIAGAHDQACAALGSGLMDQSLAEDGIGTCECLSLFLPDSYDKQTLKKLNMPCMIFPAGHQYFTILEITTCGALSDWTRDVLLKNTALTCQADGVDFFRYMDSKCSHRTTDCLVLPQFGSSGHPDLSFNPGISGCISGLTLETTEEDIYIALKESMIYQMKLAYESTKVLDLTFDKIVMTGGAAKSDLSAQLRADIYRKPVYILSNNEAGTLGCMILASVAAGEYPDIVSCTRSVVKYSKEILPDKDRFSEYEDRYLRFKELYQRMHSF